MKYLKSRRFIAVLFTFCLLSERVDGQFYSFMSNVAAGFGAAAFSGWHGLKCHFYECCDKPWIKDVGDLYHNLNVKLHGQHIAKEVIWKHITSHVNQQQPRKALVLSLHGWTGTGKNFVSKIVAESLFQKGMHSHFVKLFICPYDFPFQDEANVANYKIKIQKKIKRIVSSCGTSLFIFDEVDKAGSGLLDAIKPFVDYHEKVDGVDFRKAIFILLSNSAGQEISERVYKFWELGIRTDIKLLDLEMKTMTAALNEQGGLKNTDIVNNFLISAFVPFLPLERQHVKLCIKDELKSRGDEGVEEAEVNKVADQLEYYPSSTQAFSKTGCKRIIEKIDLIMMDHQKEL